MHFESVICAMPDWLINWLIDWLISFNTLRPRQNSRHFPDDIYKCIFLNENAWIWVKISLKFAPKGLINKIPALVQIGLTGAKPRLES